MGRFVGDEALEQLAHGGGQAEGVEVAGAAPAQLRIVGNTLPRGCLVEQQRLDIQSVMAEHVGEWRERLGVVDACVLLGDAPGATGIGGFGEASEA